MVLVRRKCVGGNRCLLGRSLLACLFVGLWLAGFATAGEDTSRAAWLLARGTLTDLAATGQQFEQTEIGGGGQGAFDVDLVEVPTTGSMHGAWPILMSAVLPGAGEAALGYRRGYAMALIDILGWTQVKKYHDRGRNLRSDYIAFADQHYTDDLLVAAYAAGGQAIDGFYRANVGTDYFAIAAPINTVADLGNLSLYVGKEADFREYYENLGKWDQFVFGWDDFVRPDDHPGYTPTGNRDPDLKQPWVSANRVHYQMMRDDSNQAYKRRDRWLYLNIGLRLFSVVQVAYLQGLLTGGDPAPQVSIAGHAVDFKAAPMGLHRGLVSAAVSF